MQNARTPTQKEKEEEEISSGGNLIIKDVKAVVTLNLG